MASFQFTSHQDIAKANDKCELKVPTVPFARRRNNGINAVWSVAFSPDRTRFAWSSGNRKVQILPWNIQTNLPIADPEYLVVRENNDNAHQQNGDEDLDSDEERMSCDGGSLDGDNPHEMPEWIQPKTIECGDIVMSLAFGSSLPHKKFKSTASVKYRMYDHSNTKLMLAIGLKSGKIKTYDIGKDVTLHLMDHKDGVREMTFNPNGSLMLVSASTDNTLKVWDLKDDGNMVKTLRDHQKPVIACSFSPNGEVMASVGCNKMAIVWDMRTFTLIHRLIGHHHDIIGCHFSTDGALLATASWDARVCVWDPYTGAALQQLHHVFPPLPKVFAGGANNNFVRGVAFSPDGSHLASVCDDKYVRFWSLWDTSDPEAVYPLENALTCAFSPDGSVLAAGTRRGQVKFLQAPMKVNKLQHLCRLSIRRVVQDTRKLDGLRTHLPGQVLQYLAYKDISTTYEEV